MVQKARYPITIFHISLVIWLRVNTELLVYEETLSFHKYDVCDSKGENFYRRKKEFVSRLATPSLLA
jgi:hypothetical protein